MPPITLETSRLRARSQWRNGTICPPPYSERKLGPRERPTMTDNPVSDGLADLRLMLRIRRFEEAVRDLRVAGDIVGSVHLEIGQEAIPGGYGQ